MYVADMVCENDKDCQTLLVNGRGFSNFRLASVDVYVYDGSSLEGDPVQ